MRDKFNTVSQLGREIKDLNGAKQRVLTRHYAHVRDFAPPTPTTCGQSWLPDVRI
jgi:hypothetical protein